MNYTEKELHSANAAIVLKLCGRRLCLVLKSKFPYIKQSATESFIKGWHLSYKYFAFRIQYDIKDFQCILG